MKRSLNVNLKVKLIVSFLLLAIIPLAFLGVMSYRDSSEAVLDALDESLLLTAKQTTKGINDWIEAMMSDVHALSHSDAIYSDDATRTQYLKTIKENAAFYESLFFVNPAGDIVSHSSSTEQINVADREYFQAAMSGKNFVSDALISKATGKLVFYIAVPVEDSTGSIIGVLAASVAMDKIINDINAIKVGDSGYAYLINKEGIFLAHPMEELIMNEEQSAFVTDNAHSKQITQDMVDGKTGNDIDVYKGVEKHVGYAPIEITGWSLGVTAPSNDKVFFKSIADLRTKAITIVVIASLIVIAIAIVITRSITNPVRELVTAANAVSEGDLRAEIHVKSKDEIGQLAYAFKVMIENLRELINHVLATVKQVDGASQQLAASSEQTTKMAEQMVVTVNELAKGATEEASTVNTTVETVNQMASAIQQIADNTQTMHGVSVETQTTAEAGNKRVSEAVAKMQQIRETVENSAQVVKTLGENSKEIGKIVDVITGIAEQTNLLALNAAIEAARAGEAGRGFAVVAEEVRKLAEGSSTAAQQIATLIGEVQAETEKAVAAMQTGTAVVVEGTTVVDQAGQAFAQIKAGVGRIVAQTQEVSAAVQQMSNGAQQIVGAMDNIANIAEESAAGTQEVLAAAEEQTSTFEEVAASAQTLAKLADELKTLVAKFTV